MRNGSRFNPASLSRSVFSFSRAARRTTCPQAAPSRTTWTCGKLDTAFKPATSLTVTADPSTRRSAAYPEHRRATLAPVPGKLGHRFQINANWIMHEAFSGTAARLPRKDAPAGAELGPTGPVSNTTKLPARITATRVATCTPSPAAIRNENI